MMPIDYAEQLCDDLDRTLVPIDRAYHWVMEDRPNRYRAALAEALIYPGSGSGVSSTS